METKLEQIAVKAVNQLPKSVVREIRTPRSVGAGGGRPPPATRWDGKRGDGQSAPSYLAHPRLPNGSPRLSRLGLCLIGEPRQQLLNLTRIVAQAAPLAVQ
jgi:hypothetical protein